VSRILGEEERVFSIAGEERKKRRKTRTTLAGRGGKTELRGRGSREMGRLTLRKGVRGRQYNHENLVVFR